MNLGGGTHHAGYEQARGDRLFNDVPVTVAALRSAGRLAPGARRGPATSTRATAPPSCSPGSADVHAAPVHGGAELPVQSARRPTSTSTCAPGTGDDAYLQALSGALDRAIPAARPELVVFLAGADPAGGRPPRAPARSRRQVWPPATPSCSTPRRPRVAPVCVCLAGGYAPDIRDTVEINLADRATRRAAQRRRLGLTGRSADPPRADQPAPDRLDRGRPADGAPTPSADTVHVLSLLPPLPPHRRRRLPRPHRDRVRQHQPRRVAGDRRAAGHAQGRRSRRDRG